MPASKILVSMAVLVALFATTSARKLCNEPCLATCIQSGNSYGTCDTLCCEPNLFDNQNSQSLAPPHKSMQGHNFASTYLSLYGHQARSGPVVSVNPDHYTIFATNQNATEQIEKINELNKQYITCVALCQDATCVNDCTTDYQTEMKALVGVVFGQDSQYNFGNQLSLMTNDEFATCINACAVNNFTCAGECMSVYFDELFADMALFNLESYSKLTYDALYRPVYTYEDYEICVEDCLDDKCIKLCNEQFIMNVVSEASTSLFNAEFQLFENSLDILADMIECFGSLATKADVIECAYAYGNEKVSSSSSSSVYYTYIDGVKTRVGSSSTSVNGVLIRQAEFYGNQTHNTSIVSEFDGNKNKTVVRFEDGCGQHNSSNMTYIDGNLISSVIGLFSQVHNDQKEITKYSTYQSLMSQKSLDKIATISLLNQEVSRRQQLVQEEQFKKMNVLRQVALAQFNQGIQAQSQVCNETCVLGCFENMEFTDAALIGAFACLITECGCSMDLASPQQSLLATVDEIKENNAKVIAESHRAPFDNSNCNFTCAAERLSLSSISYGVKDQLMEKQCQCTVNLFFNVTCDMLCATNCFFLQDSSAIQTCFSQCGCGSEFEKIQQDLTISSTTLFSTSELITPLAPSESKVESKSLFTLSNFLFIVLGSLFAVEAFFYIRRLKAKASNIKATSGIKSKAEKKQKLIDEEDTFAIDTQYEKII